MDKVFAIYSHKSKFTGKGESVENQIEMCRDYLKMHFGEEEAEKAVVLEDEGFSGKNLDRPQFKEMMKAIKDKKICAVVCYRLDRISRNIGDFATLITELNAIEVGFISIREQFDTNSPILDKVSKHIKGLPVDSQNEWALKLYLSKDDLNESVAYPVLISLFENIQSISEERGFLTISPRERVVSVMANLFQKIGATKQKRFLTNYANSIKTLFVITKMVYWLKDSDDEETIDKCQFRAAGDDIYNKFNTYGVKWTDDEYIFYINGKETARTSFGTGVSEVLENLIVGLEIPNELPTDISNNHDYKSQMIVDYVKVYQESDK